MIIQGTNPPHISGGPQFASTQLRQDLKSIQTGLAANNIKQAQDAFTALQASAPQAAQGSSPAAQALQALGQALQNGDITGAQSDVTALLQTARQNQPVRADINKIQGALTPSDLDGAQTAFASLQSLVSPQNTNSPKAQALQALGQALQSGDLAKARLPHSCKRCRTPRDQAA
jgi:hypothetical protein